MNLFNKLLVKRDFDPEHAITILELTKTLDNFVILNGAEPISYRLNFERYFQEVYSTSPGLFINTIWLKKKCVGFFLYNINQSTATIQICYSKELSEKILNEIYHSILVTVVGDSMAPIETFYFNLISNSQEVMINILQSDKWRLIRSFKSIAANNLKKITALQFCKLIRSQENF